MDFRACACLRFVVQCRVSGVRAQGVGFKGEGSGVKGL